MISLRFTDSAPRWKLWTCHLVLLQCAFVLIVVANVSAIDLRPNCGFPGKPYRSKINPEEKLVYADGESVTYSCTDYWAPPMERKCVNGQWTGPMARCGDFIRDVLMKDSQMFDISYAKPREIFHHTDMNITNTNWKYPNAFTSNRFKAARMRIDDDHEYLWKFNFTRPIPKLYVKMNFNFMNFTLLTEEQKKAHKFTIEVELSPYRTCVFDYQNHNLWRDSGNRIDTYFICEAHSFAAIKQEMADPPNYMVMRTKSSLNISHEFVALFFGRVYGNDSDPFCGEPETDYGQSFRANVEFKDYIIDCVNKEDWTNVSPDRFTRFSWSIKCVGDMVWNGTTPRCVPKPKKTCSLDGVFKRMISESTKTNGSKFTTDEPQAVASEGKAQAPIHKSHHMLVIDSIVNYYHFIDNDTVYATPGTEITYSCASDDYILVGKEMRKCKTDRTWTGSEPTCKFIKSSNELIESSNTLLVVIVVMGVLLFVIISVSCVLFVMYTKRLRKRSAELEAEKANVNQWQNEYNMYDNIELNGSGAPGGKSIDDGIYEVYERIDEYNGNGNEYTPYNDQGYTYAVMNDAGAGQYGNIHGGDTLDNNENDYVRMLRESRAYQHIAPGQNNSVRSVGPGGRVVIMRNDSRKKTRDPEPSYLEISK